MRYNVLVRRLQIGEVADFVRDVLLDPGRRQPVVAVTTPPGGGRPAVEPELLERSLEGLAEVVLIETGEATWELAGALPPRLDVYGGAVRIWWPGLEAGSDPRAHPLLFAASAPNSTTLLANVMGRVRERCAEPSLAQPARSRAAEPQLVGPDPITAAWQRVGAEWKVGDVVEGRIQSFKPFGVFVDLLPDVAGLVHKSEVDWDHVDDPRDFARIGDVVAVRILSLDVGGRRIELSIKRAYGMTPRPPIPVEPGGPPFRWTHSEGLRQPPERSRRRVLAAQNKAVAEERDAAIAERDAASEDRVRLAEQVKLLRQQLADARKETKGGEERLRNLERRSASELDPTSSERAFLLSVRLCYARMLDEDDRAASPLLRMRVGRSFLDSLRGLEGIEIGKVIEVCAQVASDTAAKIVGREVHQLRQGLRGATGHVRATDGARAWRCSLQDNTASARRLHWWRIPASEGAQATIEFARVGVHDEFTIPE